MYQLRHAGGFDKLPQKLGTTVQEPVTYVIIWLHKADAESSDFELFRTKHD